MDWVSFSAIAVSLATAAVSVWRSVRKEKRVDSAEHAALTSEEEETAIGRWKGIVRNQAAAHKAEIADIRIEVAACRKETQEMREAERKCQMTLARQEEIIRWQTEEIKCQNEELNSLKLSLNRHGIETTSPTNLLPRPPEAKEG